MERISKYITQEEKGKRTKIPSSLLSYFKGFLGTQKFVMFSFLEGVLEITLKKFDHDTLEAFLSSMSDTQQELFVTHFRAPIIDFFEKEVYTGMTYITDWSYTLTMSGYGIILPRNLLQSESRRSRDKTQRQKRRVGGEDYEKLNLWSKMYQHDFTPICEFCSCGTCKNHTRSYIHHLLSVHEISAHLLLAEHNFYQLEKRLKMNFDLAR